MEYYNVDLSYLKNNKTLSDGTQLITNHDIKLLNILKYKKYKWIVFKANGNIFVSKENDLNSYLYTSHKTDSILYDLFSKEFMKTINSILYLDNPFEIVTINITK